MTDQSLLGLMQIIALLCQHEVPIEKCVAKYENCISLNHHTEAWVTRSWVCFRDPNYPDDSGDKHK